MLGDNGLHWAPMVMLVAERVSLGERIALLRRIRHLTQRELADRIGINFQTVSNWEQGRAQVKAADIPNLAGALGVSVAELFSGESTLQESTPQAGDSAQNSELYNVAPLEDPRTLGARLLLIYRWGSLGDPRDRDSSPYEDRREYPPSGREHLIGPNGFGVDVRGNSMVGRDVHDGDVCWINPDRDYRLGDLVLALISDGKGESGMVVKTYARTDVGAGLVSEPGGGGRSTVVCAEYKIIGPVVWIQRGFPPR